MDYNPFLPDVQYNPFLYYAHLRNHAPVYQVPGVGFWAISRYEDVLAILKNPQVFSSSGYTSVVVGESDPWPPEAPVMLGIDPPDHTRLRRLANRAFTPRRVASLETHLREVVQQLLEPIATQGGCDLVRALAVPLPTIVIAELLGVPPERRDDFKRWATDFMNGMNGTAIAAEERAQIQQSVAALRAYLHAAIETCRMRPSDNLLSALVRAEEEQQTLTSEEILSVALLVLLAGKVAGTTLPAGTIVLILFGSANHDEHKFPDPEHFDILRNAEGHLGFGFGTHFCLGAQLAQLEVRIALEELLKRFPHFSRTDEPFTRIVNPFFRGLKTLPLVVSA